MREESSEVTVLCDWMKASMVADYINYEVNSNLGVRTLLINYQALI